MRSSAMSHPPRMTRRAQVEEISQGLSNSPGSPSPLPSLQSLDQLTLCALGDGPAAASLQRSLLAGGVIVPMLLPHVGSADPSVSLNVYMGNSLLFFAYYLEVLVFSF